MVRKHDSLAGCLLGMAAGDAMGSSVDKKSWQEIEEAYGPNGLLGYDLTGGSADITSYTQLALFTANALLLAVTRGSTELFSRALLLAVREWHKSQQFRGAPEKTRCWVAQVPDLRRRLCMDTQMLDALSRETLGTPEKPVFRSGSPSSLTCALAVALCYDPEKMSENQLMRLGTEAVAFTHGQKEVFLSGAFLALALARLLREPNKAPAILFEESLSSVTEKYADSWPSETVQFKDWILAALAMTKAPALSPLEAMAQLECATAAQCVAGAVYAVSVHPANFDEAMIVSVNHSGRSAAVGAIAGAFLGAKLGAENLPEFYLESLPCAPYLQELAKDLYDCRQVSRIFDADWDQKYVQGMPVT